MQVTKECCLCSTFEKTRDHLLFICTYSLEFWRLVLMAPNPRLNMFTNWGELMSWITTVAHSTIKKLVVHATIFYLWKQRNNVLHNNVSVPAAVIFKVIERVVRNSISTGRHRKQFQDLMCLWLRCSTWFSKTDCYTILFFISFWQSCIDYRFHFLVKYIHF